MEKNKSESKGEPMKHTKEYLTEQMPFKIQPTSMRGEVILTRPEFHGERAINFQMPGKLASVITSRVNGFIGLNPSAIQELVEAVQEAIKYFEVRNLGGTATKTVARLQQALERVSQ